MLYDHNPHEAQTRNRFGVQFFPQLTNIALRGPLAMMYRAPFFIKNPSVKTLRRKPGDVWRWTLSTHTGNIILNVYSRGCRHHRALFLWTRTKVRVMKRSHLQCGRKPIPGVGARRPGTDAHFEHNSGQAGSIFHFIWLCGATIWIGIRKSTN